MARDIRTGGGRKKSRPIHVAALRKADEIHKKQRQREKKIAIVKERQAQRGHTGAAQILVPKSPAPSLTPGQLARRIDKDIGAVTGFRPGAIPGHVRELIPGTREWNRQHQRLAKGQKPEVSIGIVPGMPFKPKVPIGRAAKAAAKELKAHPVRQAFHSNIDKTVADKQLAAKMKQTFDRETLRRAKKAGVGPGQYLDKQKGPAAAPKVTAGLSAGRAQTLRREQEALASAERSKRAGKLAEALQANPGTAGFKAGKQELRGELPKVQFHGLKNLTDEEMNNLDSHVANHSELLPYEKLHVHDALHNARDLGTLPTNYDRGLLRKAFGPEVEKELFTPTRLQKAQHAAIETANIPRAVMASFDVSAPMRQGIVAMSRHPVITGRNLGPMLKSFGSEKYYQARRAKLESNPYYEEARSHGLAVTDVEHSLANREEAFQSNYAEKIPLAGRVVRSSGRAYTDVLVNDRMDIYAHLRQLADKQGVPLDRKALKDLTGYINSATGRGGLGQFERSAVGLNSVFFSPRLIASRLDFLVPWRYARLDPFVRKQKLRAAAQFGAMLTTVLYLADQVAGVDVGVDPRSTDFGKIRIGDTTLDLTGGFSQYARLAAQLGSGQKINQKTGAIQKGRGVDTLTRFFRAKLAPTAGVGVDVATRSQYSGLPIDVKSEIGSHLTPLGMQDAYSTYKNTKNPLAAAGVFGASAVGVGVQQYKKSPKYVPPVALEDALRTEVRKYFHKDLPPQIKQALRLRETRTKYLDKEAKKAKDDGRKFTPVDRYNAQVDLLVKLGKINSGQAREAKGWAASQKGAKGSHKVASRADTIAGKYFGGDVLTSAGKKLRARGSQFYLGDH